MSNEDKVSELKELQKAYEEQAKKIEQTIADISADKPLDIEYYVHVAENELAEHQPHYKEEVSNEAWENLKYFLLEHKLGVQIDRKTGDYVVTHFDGRLIAPE